MKYSILGFNQKLVIKYNDIDVMDLLLLDYIYNAIASPSMAHIVEDNVCYVWLQHSKIHSDLPILQISEERLKKRIKKLVDLQLLQSKQIFNSKLRGSRAYYAITKKCENLRFSSVENDTCSDEQVSKTTLENSLASVENDTSYSLLTRNNSKLEKDSKNYSVNRPNSLLPDNNSKQHTIQEVYNLYLKLCPNLPKPRTLNDKRKKLIMKAYKQYGIQTLKELFTKANASQFLCGNNDRGWKADIEWILGDKSVNILEGKYDSHKSVSTLSTKPWEKNVKSVAMTAEEREAEEREADRLEAQGKRARF